MKISLLTKCFYIMNLVYKANIMDSSDKATIHVDRWRRPVELLRLVVHPARLMILSVLREKPQSCNRPIYYHASGKRSRNQMPALVHFSVNTEDHPILRIHAFNPITLVAE
jgi:hypothetical protein